MPIPLLQLPTYIPGRPERQPQDNVPQTREQRQNIQKIVNAYVEETNPVPPLSREEIRDAAQGLIEAHDLQAQYLDYIGVIISNESWREQLASIPFNRRLLLLPKCLRDEERCPAPFDEFGLLCKDCGLCSIQDLQEEAERLGYAVLTAEGSAIVMAIIETGKIDAIVGVSCLSVLEKAFPYMEAAAVPGIAIPLLQDDCKDTNVDLDLVWDLVHFTSDDKTRRLDLGVLQQEVESWFTADSLNEIMGMPASETERIARDWLTCDGKRWRPFLAACAAKALQDDPQAPLSKDFRKIAVAVECFHKASLVHDDIQDDDDVRYGIQTVHAKHGVPMAINVGDLLIGYGYQMIAACDASAERKAQMLTAAANGHRTLCLGQGAELAWAQDPSPLASRQVLEIFRQKTAPAFEVALRMGARYAGATDELADMLGKFSEALGIAYQIRDDLDDVMGSIDSNDAEAMRPSVIMAVAAERAKKEDKVLMESLWRHKIAYADVRTQVDQIIGQYDALERCGELLEAYKEEAIRCLRTLESASLKGLLRRVMGKIFKDLEIKGWCSEYEARNASGGQARTQAVG
jgi:geranylgeranyl diphosphate synthase type II